MSIANHRCFVALRPTVLYELVLVGYTKQFSFTLTSGNAQGVYKFNRTNFQEIPGGIYRRNPEQVCIASA